MQGKVIQAVIDPLEIFKERKNVHSMAKKKVVEHTHTHSMICTAIN